MNGTCTNINDKNKNIYVISAQTSNVNPNESRDYFAMPPVETTRLDQSYLNQFAQGRIKIQQASIDEGHT